MKKRTDQEDKRKIFKNVKLEYVLIVILTIVVIVIFLSGSNLSLNVKSTETESDYLQTLQNNLTKVLGDVNGAGKVNVMITLDGSSEEVVLKNVESTLENGVKTTKETIVLIGGKPYVVKTVNPNVVGVVVVAEGADDLNVKMAILEVVTTTLSINGESVRIIKMK